MKKFIIFLLFIFILLLFASPSHADSNFPVSFDVTYTVKEDGITHVVFNGNMENVSNKYYATSYTMQLGFTDIQNLHVSDSKGSIVATIKETNAGKSLYIPFNAKVYRPKKLFPFTIAFDTTNIAKHAGNIWEINIPGIANQTDFKDFTVHVRVPSSFGKQAYSKPSTGNDSLDFDKQALGNAGISLAFGTVQVFDFTLYYHLKNSNLFPITTEIALPPTTNYQDIVMHDMKPNPTNVRIDSDGNWLASYYLFPSQKITVTAKGSAYISLEPKEEKLSAEQKKVYIQQQPYWEIYNESLQKLAHDLHTPENIFLYVANHLQYDFTRIAGKQERVGAEKILKHPASAVCLEFTDLFIALARAAGIPAREIDGYAYTENPQQRPIAKEKDVLHAWAEYYDEKKQTWIMVDPTWANTTKGTDYFRTLDFDHVAFVIRGEKSMYPIPPGGYKFSQKDSTKDVFVIFGKEETRKSPQVGVSFDVTPFIFSDITGNLIFQNASSRLVSSQTVTITNPLLDPKKQKLQTQPIPPFGYAQLPVKFQNNSFLTNTSVPITIQVAGNTITKKVSVSPFFFQKKYIIGGIICVIFCIGLSIITTRTRGVSFFRRK